MPGAGPEPVRAAGGLVWRSAGETVEVVVVHRPRYDDWTLPKGKAEPGETDEETAVREVEEETGLRCTLGPELVSTSYVDNKGRPKVVRYWTMQVDAAQPWEPDHEVDEVRWVPVEALGDLLSYDRDRAVVESFDPADPAGPAAQPASPPVDPS
jgi:8-oxo-dGTP diphosphatase